MIDIDSLEIEYPALYVAADAQSTRAQKTHMRGIFILLILLVSSSLTSLIAGDYQFVAILSVVILALTPILSLILAVKRYDKIWYSGRSLAESIKTISWRYMMRSQPYEAEVQNVRSSFQDDLKQLFEKSKSFCQHLSGSSTTADPIPDNIENIRRCERDERKQIYAKYRIDEQRAWYGKKGAYNNRMSSRWFYLMIGFQLLAIACAAIRISHLEWGYLPTGVFAACAAAVVGWIQAKRFQDLGTSYTLTAHEIGMVKMSFDDIQSEKQFSEFVGDAENAFSREHTQWLARRDT